MYDLETVLRNHYQRYPLMQIEDFVKLIYQITFGPRHLSEHPSKPEILDYLTEELNQTSLNPNEQVIVDISDQYVRVSLDAILNHMISKESMASAFLQSMNESPTFDDAGIATFRGYITLLLSLIKQGEIALPYATCVDFIQNYYTIGIRPIRHSLLYNQTYHPHYRVIQRNLLLEPFSNQELPFNPINKGNIMAKVTTKKNRFLGIDKNPSLLGFGCMRLPTLFKDKPDIDEETAQRMIDYAHSHGVTYYDTAYPYHHGMSETFIGKALKKFPRDSFYLASKMPSWLIHGVDDAKRIFAEQLQKCQVDYFDYYLCHALGTEQFKPYLIPGVMDFLYDLKKQGKIRHLGFSFHDTPEVLEEIIHTYTWDFVQIQCNYLDWTLIDAKQQYEIVEKSGIPCIIMEPVRGGTLATLCDESQNIFKQADHDASVASWAIRYVASKPNVMVVLSGMSNEEQTRDNIKTMSDFQPITDDEQVVIDKALEVFIKSRTVPCTACRYCMPCPQGVDIPRMFKLYNHYAISKNKWEFVESYEEVEPSLQAANCIACGDCLSKCPQRIMIPNQMCEIAERFETLKLEIKKH